MTLPLRSGVARWLSALAAVTILAAGWPHLSAQGGYRSFATPEEAVRGLAAAVKGGKLDEVLAFFGPEGTELISSSEPAIARANRDVFTAAIAEGWRLVDDKGGRKTLVIGNEEWPFPVPLIRDGKTWRFDAAAGKEEVLARRIGRNELEAIAIVRTYVGAQQRYAEAGHDGKPAGVYAAAFRSDPGTQNGLYWPAGKGEKRSPLGDLVAQAATEGRGLERNNQAPQPFHGYFFRILTAQGAKAPGGAKSYVVNGNLSGGFALVAWPAQYDATGVMTFVVNQSGVVWQKDLGPETGTVVGSILAYEPDKSWTQVR